MFCNNCGSKIENGSKFCANCGTKISESSDFVESPKQVQYQPHSSPTQQAPSQQYSTPTYSSPPTHLRKKEPAIALILSLLVIVGSGHIYAGKVGKGIGIIIGVIVCFVLIYVGIFTFVFALSGIAGACILGLAIYGHIDAYNTAKKYNQFLLTHGRPPSSNDNW